MKNKWFPILLILPVVTGVCGALLRAGQLTFAFDAETGLLKSGSPFTAGLITVSVIAIAMALISAFILKNGVRRAAGKGSAILVSGAFAGILLLVLGALEIFGIMKTSFELVRLIFALLSVYCAIALIVLGKYRLVERDSGVYSVFAAVPVFWACFSLILLFREKIPDPILADYMIQVFGYICILVFTYGAAAQVLGKNRRVVSVLSCFSGMYFIIVELASPFIAHFINPQFEVASRLTAVEVLPQLAFLIFMPAACAYIVRRGASEK